MIDLDRLFRPPLGECNLKPRAGRLDSLKCGAEMHGYVPDDCIASEPAGCGSQMARDRANAQSFGQRMKYERDVAGKTRTPARAESGPRFLYSFDERTRFAGRILKSDG